MCIFMCTVYIFVFSYSFFALLWAIGQWVECLPVVHETRVQSQVEPYQRL